MAFGLESLSRAEIGQLTRILQAWNPSVDPYQHRPRFDATSSASAYASASASPHEIDELIGALPWTSSLRHHRRHCPPPIAGLLHKCFRFLPDCSDMAKRLPCRKMSTAGDSTCPTHAALNSVMADTLLDLVCTELGPRLAPLKANAHRLQNRSARESITTLQEFSHLFEAVGAFQGADESPARCKPCLLSAVARDIDVVLALRTALRSRTRTRMRTRDKSGGGGREPRPPRLLAHVEAWLLGLLFSCNEIDSEAERLAEYDAIRRESDGQADCMKELRKRISRERRQWQRCVETACPSPFHPSVGLTDQAELPGETTSPRPCPHGERLTDVAEIPDLGGTEAVIRSPDEAAPPASWFGGRMAGVHGIARYRFLESREAVDDVDCSETGAAELSVINQYAASSYVTVLCPRNSCGSSDAISPLTPSPTSSMHNETGLPSSPIVVPGHDLEVSSYALDRNPDRPRDEVTTGEALAQSYRALLISEI